MDTIDQVSLMLGIISVLLGLVSLIGLWLGAKQGRLISEIAQLTDTLRSTQVAAADLEILEKLGVLRQHAVNLNAGDLRRVEQAAGDVRAVLSLLALARDEVRDDLLEAIACVLDALRDSDDEDARSHGAALCVTLGRAADGLEASGSPVGAARVRALSGDPDKVARLAEAAQSRD
jgi:hypothetical protein